MSETSSQYYFFSAYFPCKLLLDLSKFIKMHNTYIIALLFNLLSMVNIQAENRISSMTSSRSDWCISRQRTWGVPIPVFYHVKTKEPLITEETINHVKGIFICRPFL